MGKELKKYKSGCVLSLTVTMKDGSTKYVRFDDSSHGSVLYTDDEKLQWALENNYLFNKSYVLDGASRVEEEEPDGDPSGTVADEDDNEDVNTEAQDGEDTPESESNVEAAGTSCVEEMKKVTVSGAEDAVEYLVENYNVSRKSLKKMASIIDIAKEHGVVFDGLN